MTGFFRAGAITVAAGALWLASWAGARAQAHRPDASQAASEALKRDGVWGQSYSDLKPEGDVRFGQLANGMRYAVMRNATPRRQASLRLRVGAGSLEERDDQQGLAHFLEHMAFKGSTHVPAGEMIKILERKGLAFGPDTNASTTFEQTVYQLDLPETDNDTLDIGLMLMRETASELTLAAEAMEPERGVVLSEERLRDSPAFEAEKAYLGFLLHGGRAPLRWPIGQVETIRHAPVDLVRQYYAANYRPDDTTLVAVGDFDPDAMEARIKARFGDWKPKVAAPAPVVAPGGLTGGGDPVALFVAPGAPRRFAVGWRRPYDPAADTRARERRDIVQFLATAILDRRYAARVRAANSPLSSAGVSVGNVLDEANATQIHAASSGDDWKPALAAALEEQRRIVRYGVRADEVAREKEVYRTALIARADGAASRSTPSLANEIVSVVNDDDVFTGPQQNLALFESLAENISPADIDGELRAMFAGDGPILFMSSPTPVAGGRAAVASAFASARTTPVADSQSIPVKPWPYACVSQAGCVTQRRIVADLGLEEVTFANGVRLTLKPSKFSADQLGVIVRVGRGRLSLPRDRPSPTWALGAVTEGGLRDLTIDDMQRTLSGKIWSVSVGIDDDAFQLAGRTRREDLNLELQVLTAYLTHPGFRPEVFRRAQQDLGHALEQVGSTPSGVFGRDYAQLLHDGDLRWRTAPSVAELAKETPDELPALLDPVFAEAPISVTIVGDAAPEGIVQAVGRTLGALPPRHAAPPVKAEARVVRFPKGGGAPVVELHAGRSDQAVAAIAWPTQGFYADPHGERVLDIATQVFENRLIERVRIEEGASYSPGAAAQASQVFPSYGYVMAQVETPPDKIDGFYHDVSAILASLRAAPPTADEMERARNPILEQQTKLRQANAFWLNRLSAAQDDPRELDAIRGQLVDLQSVTAAQVQAAVARYLTDARAWRMVVRAAAPTPGAADQTPIPLAAPPTDSSAPVTTPPTEPPPGSSQRAPPPPVDRPTAPNPTPPSKSSASSAS